jgi:hypothetical protein
MKPEHIAELVAACRAAPNTWQSIEAAPRLRVLYDSDGSDWHAMLLPTRCGGYGQTINDALRQVEIANGVTL